MRARTRGMVATVAAGLAAALACTPPDDPLCPNGLLPWDGQSNVDPDTRLVFRTGGELPRDLPDLSEAIALRDGQGRRVPLAFEVDADRGQIVATPRDPLRPDTTYEVDGIEWDRLSDGGHWWGNTSGMANDYTWTTFRTGSELAVLDAVSLGDGASFVLVFSEPVDPASVEGRLIGRPDATSSTGSTQPIEDTGAPDDAPPVFEVLGAYDQTPNLVWVALVEGRFGAGTLTVLQGVRARAGDEGGPEDLWLDLSWDESRELARLDGRPWCITEGSDSY